ncbi:GAP family protein [Yinghuangia sp. YIM S09857]|uniref:GAP family protein n=1 Tax=Yinghuangia sp. YIM S09857 TaxID=3436929 RepID=UPI003F535A87
MGDAVGQVLSPAIGVAVSPIPLIAVVLMLATPKGRANGLAFTAGWIVALAAGVALLVTVGAGGGADDGEGGKSAEWTYWIKLGIAVLFLFLAAKQWHDRPASGQEPELPSWMRTIDRFTPAKSAGLAFLLAIVNPKNLALVVAAGVSIAGAATDTGARVAAGAVFVAVGSLCTAVPLGVYLVGGAGAARTLDGWKTWMARHNGAIMAVLFLVLGVKSLGDAISGLTS